MRKSRSHRGLGAPVVGLAVFVHQPKREGPEHSGHEFEQRPGGCGPPDLRQGQGQERGTGAKIRTESGDRDRCRDEQDQQNLQDRQERDRAREYKRLTAELTETPTAFSLAQDGMVVT